MHDDSSDVHSVVLELIERQARLTVYLRQCAINQEHAAAKLAAKQWLALDAQIKQLCFFILDCQQLRIRHEAQLAEHLSTSHRC